MPKRQRSGSSAGDQETMPSDSVVRSQELWFDDGNTVLQAENTQFKVHRGVLSKHSPIFADLFRVPQPTNEPTVDGCPVVQLPDSADDVTHILAVLYGDT